MSSDDIINALRQVLAQDRKNGALWLHLAELLRTAGRHDEGVDALRAAAECAPVRRAALRKLVTTLKEQGKLSEALMRAEGLLEEDSSPELRREFEEIQAAWQAQQGVPQGSAGVRPAPDAPPDEPAKVSIGGDESGNLDDWAAQFDWGDLKIRLSDVAGLDDVKRELRLRVIAPSQQPEVYQAFGREAGGGVLLYGPPGCGKTFLARAIAGEISASFIAAAIHEIMDKWMGETEKAIHALFELARRRNPTVVFFDEFDALGTSRGKGGSPWITMLVDQILQEMDGVGKRNRGVLILGATNAPWGVDSAFRRPGRFDRVLFVPPPDTAARKLLLRKALDKLPGGPEVAIDAAVKNTALYSGADLRSLVERAGERALEASLTSSKVVPVTQADLDRALKSSRPSTLEWIATARNHARFANEGGQYDDLVAFLKSVQRW